MTRLLSPGGDVVEIRQWGSSSKPCATLHSTRRLTPDEMAHFRRVWAEGGGGAVSFEVGLVDSPAVRWADGPPLLLDRLVAVFERFVWRRVRAVVEVVVGDVAWIVRTMPAPPFASRRSR